MTLTKRLLKTAKQALKNTNGQYNISSKVKHKHFPVSSPAQKLVQKLQLNAFDCDKPATHLIKTIF